MARVPEWANNESATDDFISSMANAAMYDPESYRIMKQYGIATYGRFAEVLCKIVEIKAELRQIVATT